MTILHVSALYGVWLTLMSTKWQTIYAMYFFGITSAIGVLAGAHRLWSHRAYKAKWQLRVRLFDIKYIIKIKLGRISHSQSIENILIEPILIQL